MTDDEYIEYMQSRRVGDLEIKLNDKLYYSGFIFKNSDGSLLCHPKGAEQFGVAVTITYDDGKKISIESAKWPSE
jgi:hypothetical protein